jgi:hypothetical protein
MSNKKETSSEIISENIKENSFKIKPILLELPNYEYLHSTTKDSDEDRKGRFVGRKNIINKILSFIHESSKNTGTYLITGYRGMGKTSVVNKALETLNPRSNVETYIVLWIFMLPWVFFSEKIKNILNENNSVITSIILIFILVSLILFTCFILSRHNWKRKKLKDNWKEDFETNLDMGFKSFLNPSFKKSKHSFPRNFRKLSIYLCMVIVFLIVVVFSQKENYNLKNILFWKLTFVILSHYLFLKISSKIDSKKGISIFKIRISNYLIIYFYIFFIACVIFFDFLIIPILGYSHEIISVLVILLFSLVYYNVCRKKPIEEKDKTSIYQTPFNNLTSHFNFNHYLSIKVNLGKDILTEKDVLKYIVNELHKEYSIWHKNYKNFVTLR